MFYTMSLGFAYRRNSYVVITLAPLIAISALIVFGMWWWQGTPWVALLAICGVVNASGAIGDIWITALLLQYSAAAYVMDDRDGIQVFAHDLSVPVRQHGRSGAPTTAMPAVQLKGKSH